MNQISIVIPTRDPHQCAALIGQLHHYGHHDIVVVHPAHTATYPGVRHVATPTLVSAARARNLGISACTGTIICVIDDDVVLRSDVPRWLAYCLQELAYGPMAEKSAKQLDNLADQMEKGKKFTNHYMASKPLAGTKLIREF